MDSCIVHWNDIQHQGNGPVHLVGSHCVERMMEDRDELGEEEEAEDDDDTDDKTANKEKSKDKAWWQKYSSSTFATLIY